MTSSQACVTVDRELNLVTLATVASATQPNLLMTSSQACVTVDRELNLVTLATVASATQPNLLMTSKMIRY
jgi:hypothetical protein